MPVTLDQTPEERSRVKIDAALRESGWVVQDRREVNLLANRGVAVREFPLKTGEADYLPFVDGIRIRCRVRSSGIAGGAAPDESSRGERAGRESWKDRFRPRALRDHAGRTNPAPYSHNEALGAAL